MDNPKLCKDCRYYVAPSLQQLCYAPENMEISLIDGAKRPQQSPNYLRSADATCGYAAKWFEPKVQA
jgi:hypothetical protein